MKESYFDFITSQTDLKRHQLNYQNGALEYMGVSLMDLVKKYSSPLRIFVLPSIRKRINNARTIFSDCMKQVNYDSSYHYAYCLKSCHYHEVVKTALEEGSHLETSSTHEVAIIRELVKNKTIKPQIEIIHNGYKTEPYLTSIRDLIKESNNQVTVIIDSWHELENLEVLLVNSECSCNIGLRVTLSNNASTANKSSRLGMDCTEILKHIDKLSGSPSVTLKMIHFYVDQGIDDSPYYWEQLSRVVDLYIQLKREHENLDAINIGGGFPMCDHLNFDFDYQDVVTKILMLIKKKCVTFEIALPRIYSEFGKYTVGESGVLVYNVIDEKIRPESESWYLLDNSVMNLMPDVWASQKSYIVLPINQWHQPYKEVILGGLTCDSMDYYNSHIHGEPLLMPTLPTPINSLYIGFFYTGAYQDALSGVSGVKHCLLPSPNVLFIDRKANGELTEKLLSTNLGVQSILSSLGYNQ